MLCPQVGCLRLQVLPSPSPLELALSLGEFVHQVIVTKQKDFERAKGNLGEVIVHASFEDLGS